MSAQRFALDKGRQKGRTQCQIRHLWPALCLLLVTGVALTLWNFAGTFSRPVGPYVSDSLASTGAQADQQEPPRALSVAAAPVNCSLGSSGAPWMTSCYSLDDNGKAVLSPTVLQLLRQRQQHSQPVEDWFQLGNSSRAVLQCTSFNIPKVIHQIWVGSASQPKKWLDTWRTAYVAKCPGWTHKLWTEKDLASLQTLDESFLKNEPTNNGRANILRAAILYEHGGVYVDADIQWVNQKCLDDFLLLASDTGFLAAPEPGTDFVANSVIAAVRHHPIARLYQQVQVVFTTDERTRFDQPWQRSGPLGLTAAMRVADNHASTHYCAQSTAGSTATPEARTKATGQDTDESSSKVEPAGALNATGNTSMLGPQTATANKLVVQQGYFDEAVPAAASFLMTILDSRYFYPIHWSKHTLSRQITNVAYVSNMAKALYPETAMYQLGFNTHVYVPLGADSAQ